MEATMFGPEIVILSTKMSKDNYIGVGRKIECHSLVDTEHQENQWAL